MTDALKLIRETLIEVYPRPWLLLFTLGAIAYLLIRRKTEGQRLAAMSGGLLFFLFCLPPVAYILGMRMREGAVYWRFLWLVPVPVLLPLAAVRLAGERKTRSGRVVTALILAVLLFLGGSPVYRSENFAHAASTDKLRQITMTAATVINENAAQTGNGYKRLMAPVDVRCEIRQFDATILSCVGRSFHGTEGDDSDSYVYFNRIIDGISADYKHKIMGYVRYYESNYLLTRTAYGFAQDLAEGGMEKIYDLDGWEIWYGPEIANTKHAHDFD